MRHSARTANIRQGSSLRPASPVTIIHRNALLATSVLAISASTSAWAQQYKSCPAAGDNAECTINSGDDVDGAVVRYWAPTAQDDDKNGAGAGNYTLNNNANITASGTQNNVLYLRLTGGNGYANGHGDSTDGGYGGAVYIHNYADIAIEGTASTSDSGFEDGKAPGVWDDVGAVAAIYGAGIAGNGGNSTADVGGGNGGRGGQSGQGFITNDGNVHVYMPLPYGGAGIYAAMTSGDGGQQNNTAGDQDGGNGGEGQRDFWVQSTGDVAVKTPYANKYAWGIGVEAIGGKGGFSNGRGGDVGQPNVRTWGTVTVDVEGTDGFPVGVRGIYLSSIGGPGYAQVTSDGSDDGGAGSVGQHLKATVTGDVTVISHSIAAPDDAFEPQENPADYAASTAALQQSGGIVLYSRGGDGGAGPLRAGSSKRYGGMGQGASYDYKTGGYGQSYLRVDNASVTTEGDYLPGIAVLSVGGIGGWGREDSNGGAGGFGGNVGVDFEWGATLSTDGAQSAGIVARSQGGPGGDFHPSSGFVDFSPNFAGTGGKGGSVDVNFGVIFNGDKPGLTDATTIITKGDDSSGIVAQSFGAQGGATGDSFQLLGQEGASTGYGGSGGTVVVNAHGDITTQGSHSRGILMQSVGNSGGAGGVSSGLYVVGGAEGAGGNGNTVEGVFGANVTTTGEAGTAILAQSIGGGGGIADSAHGAEAVGGQGGSGGTGGRVDLTALGGGISTEGDFAYGIVGQSIGGGGGDGGSTFTIAAGSVPATGVGGAGGVGGTGGNVTITNDDSSVDLNISGLEPLSVTTGGDNAHGVVAQSIGGGGGTGGDADGGGVSLYSFQMAGGAESGGGGNEATLEFDGASVTTTGSHAIGLVAQSVGGGGGTGGSAYSFDLNAGFSLSVGVGGLAGDGGTGGSASVDLANTVVTTGKDDRTDAHGIVVQSVGGGGGVGGSSVSKAVAKSVSVPDTDVSIGFAASVAVGGKGGGGGDGGTATATLQDTSITTLGDGSMGLIAQAIGGGGGIGGSASSSAGVIGGENSYSASVSAAVGGSGNTGGAGGKVDVSVEGTSTIETSGDYASAILAQSIGGGGGSGGVGSASTSHVPDGFSLQATIGVGGSGEGGGSGNGATVNLESGTLLQTSGAGARGVLVQSIGGGGGASQGVSVGLSGSGSPPDNGGSEDGGDEDGSDVTAKVNVSVGRTGGGGGGGGAVNVTTAGTIVTSGGDADGVLAQSIGGGGGLGGSGASATPDDSESPDDDSTSYEFTVAVGGEGGEAANGGPVTLTHAGHITTKGDWADGIVAQSIGGGGGTGGTSSTSDSQATASIDLTVAGGGGGGGAGGDVDITFDDNRGNSIETAGYSAYGVLLQSIGGGGGQGGDGSDQAEGTITVGGEPLVKGNSDNTGGKVTGRGWINLWTTGDDAHGIVAQSIGGGGGVGGAGSSTAAMDDDSHAIDLVVGGIASSLIGAVDDSGGEVNLTLGTNLFTRGDRAFGIVAQSIGGGGGIGGAGEADSIGKLAIGSFGSGVGKNGGTVTVDITSKSWIRTYGVSAHGIVAQSIGGGGGIGGAISGAPLSLKGHLPAGVSDGEDVFVTLDGSITTSGDYAFGVLAQSIGGGGGFGGNGTSAFIGSNGNIFPQGKSGKVTVDLKAGRQISATGKDSVGIFAQSDSGQVDGAITVDISGSVTGGSGDRGAGVWVVDGKDNVLTVKEGGSVSAASGTAIRYDGNFDTAYGSVLTVNNYGTISGNALLNNTEGANAGTVNNYSNNTLIDASLYQAHVMNQGRLVVGHSGRIDATEITGDFMQGPAGTLAVDVDFNSFGADRLQVRGDAQLGGTLDLQATSLLPYRDLTVLTVDGTADGAITPEVSKIFGFALTPTGHDYRLSVASAHFAEPGFALSEDQEKVAGHLQDIWDAGGGSYGRLFGTLGSLADSNQDDYASALSDMSFGASGAAAASSIVMTQQHLDLLQSCPTFAAGSSLLTETECVWSQAGGQVLDQKAWDGISGFDNATYSLQTGAQFEVSPDWFVGIAGGYDRSSINGDDDRVESDGDTLYAGISLKHEVGPWLLSGSVAGSYGWFDNTRTIQIPGFAGQAESDSGISNFSARVRAAYTFAQDQYYVRPLVDLDLIYSHASGYRESGTGPLDLLVEDAGQWSLNATPAVEVGTRVAVSETTVMRAFAAAGVSFSSADSWDTSAQLANAPAGVGTFDSEVPLADVVGRLAAGIDLASDNGFSVRMNYQGAFSDTYTSHGGSLRLSYKF